MIRIQKEPIDTLALTNGVGDENAGAVILFVGTTRRMTGARETIQLEYDCYEPMAIAELGKLRDEAMERWPLKSCAIVHRVGVVENGQASVAVAISSPHRKEAFDACQWIMDDLKRRVPIWKREQWADGSTGWVHPEQPRQGN